jgi:hypothetical protein
MQGNAIAKATNAVAAHFKRHERVQFGRVTTRPQRWHWTVEVPPAGPNPRVALMILKS